jgi:integral membrane protein
VSRDERSVAGLRGALLRYRVMAYTVGVGLILLVFVGMPLQYWGGNPAVVGVVGPLHGFLYIIYLLAAADLFRRIRWPFSQLVWVILAGLVPFVAFVVERRVTHRVEAQLSTGA